MKICGALSDPLELRRGILGTAASKDWESAKTNPLQFRVNKKRHPFCLFSLTNEAADLFTIIHFAVLAKEYEE